jgi:hypothetical protein
MPRSDYGTTYHSVALYMSVLASAGVADGVGVDLALRTGGFHVVARPILTIMDEVPIVKSGPMQLVIA